MDDQTNPQQQTQSPVQGSINLNEQSAVQSPPQPNDLLSPPPPDTPPSDGRKIVRIALIIFSILFFITIVVLGVVAYQRNQTFVQNQPTPTPEQESPTPTLIPTNTPAASPSAYINNAEGDESAVFSSNTLGIQFRYLPEENGNVIVTEESGNKVYVYPESLGRDGAQFVEIFEKPDNQQIKEAITKKFLDGKDPAKCFVEEVQDGDRLRYEIAFDQDYSAPQEEWFQKSEYCSPEYARTNGMRYFWYDPSKPTKYAFFSIGQYSIPAEDGKGWQDTFEFIK